MATGMLHRVVCGVCIVWTLMYLFFFVSAILRGVQEVRRHMSILHNSCIYFFTLFSALCVAIDVVVVVDVVVVNIMLPNRSSKRTYLDPYIAATELPSYIFSSIVMV